MTNSPLKHKLIVLPIILFGIISNAHEPNECFEYSGYVVSRETGEPIANVIVDMKNSGNGQETSLRTDQRGRYRLLMPCNKKSKIVFYSEGYSKESRVVKTGENLKSPSINNRVYMTPLESLIEKVGVVEKIKVGHINFESIKSTRIAQEEIALEKVLFTMLKFPEIRIKIESHSNVEGTDISKAVTSYFRAKAARRYLIKQGIDGRRIESANGYGTESVDHECANAIALDDQEPGDNGGSNFIIVAK